MKQLHKHFIMHYISIKTSTDQQLDQFNRNTIFCLFANKLQCIDETIINIVKYNVTSS